MLTAFIAAALHTPVETFAPGVLLVRDGRIERLGARPAVEIPASARVIDCDGDGDRGDSVLAPGLIDLHVHGGGGHDFMDAAPEDAAAVERMMARHGVAGYLATTVTAPWDQTLRALERLARPGPAVAGTEDRARRLGIHLEGPFISHARRGVHPDEHILEPSPARFERLWEAAEGRIRVLTLAPEVPGAVATIAAAVGHGVRVSLGHSNADWRATQAAIAAGASQATHAFNAMPAFDHRVPNLLTAALADARLRAECIADGIHVHPAVIELLLKAKGADGVLLVTDAISATGMPDGSYRLGTLTVEVRDGRCVAEGRLAGSVLTLDRAVRNVMRFARWPLAAALRLATLNPARALGLESSAGILAPGAPADFVILSPAGEVRQVFLEGTAV